MKLSSTAMFLLMLLAAQGLAASIDHCKKMSPEGDLCLECDQGFGLLDDKSACLQCPKNCLSCSQYSDKMTCNKCSPNFYLFKSYVNICLEVDPNCKTYEDFKGCTVCQDNYFPGSPYSQFGSCTKCSDNCSECKERVGCSTCNQQFFLQQDNVCTACPKYCDTCVDRTGCSKCANKFFRNYVGGYYICNQCRENCSVCSSYSSCTTCDEGYYQYSYYSGSCTPCKVANCKTCTSYTPCSECKAGYMMISNFASGAICDDPKSGISYGHLALIGLVLALACGAAFFITRFLQKNDSNPAQNKPDEGQENTIAESLVPA